MVSIRRANIYAIHIFAVLNETAGQPQPGGWFCGHRQHLLKVIYASRGMLSSPARKKQADVPSPINEARDRLARFKTGTRGDFTAKQGAVDLSKHPVRLAAVEMASLKFNMPRLNHIASRCLRSFLLDIAKGAVGCVCCCTRSYASLDCN